MHDLPDFVYVNHSIHVKKGMGCKTCHGRVDELLLYCFHYDPESGRYGLLVMNLVRVGGVRP